MKGKKLLIIAVMMIAVLALAACEEDPEVDGAVYVDGTYTGSAEGYGGDIEVEVTVEDDVISEIEVLSHSETEDIGGDAMDQIIDEAIGQEDTADIDSISGATVTSDAFKAAIEEALAEAMVTQGE